MSFRKDGFGLRYLIKVDILLNKDIYEEKNIYIYIKYIIYY